MLRSLGSFLSAESTHILNGFHLTMRLTVLKQCARGLTHMDAASGNALQEGLISDISGTAMPGAP